MPTINQISDKISRGKLLQANLVKVAIQYEVTGDEPKNWGEIVCLSQLIQALTAQVVGQDYTSATTVNLYNQLTDKLGFQYVDGAVIDPNAQQSAGIIFIGNQPGQVINSNIIPFVNQTEVSLSNFQGAYYPLYGNTRQIQVFVSDGANGFNPDYGNVPVYEYTIAGNETSGIASVTWGFPIPTSGYISIFGIKPTT